MRLNRKKISETKKNNNNLLELNKNLMSKFQEDFQSNTFNIRNQFQKQSATNSNKIKSQFVQDFQIIDLGKNNPYTTILQKAKAITTINKNQIERAKKIIKKSQHQEGAFLTGCGLYTSYEKCQQQFSEPQEQIDLNDALKYLVKNQKDDLAQLRKLIRKTNTNLNQYSNDIYKTQNQVQQAAEMFDLKMKITKCGFTKGENQTVSKRKISTSNRSKR